MRDTTVKRSETIQMKELNNVRIYVMREYAKKRWVESYNYPGCKKPLTSVTCTYSMVVWGSCGSTLFGDLENIHVRAAKLIYSLDWFIHQRKLEEVWRQTKWKPSKQMYIRRVLCLVYKCVSGDAPVQLQHLWTENRSNCNLRRKMFWQCLYQTQTSSKSQLHTMHGATLWNSLNNEAHLKESLASFKGALKEISILRLC